jgi:hypothetical protein
MRRSSQLQPSRTGLWGIHHSAPLLPHGYPKLGRCRRSPPP